MGERRAVIPSGRFPVWADQAGHAAEGAGSKFGDQEPCGIDRPRHFHLTLRNAFKSGLGIDRLVAHEYHELVAARLRLLESALDQRGADAVRWKRGVDRQ